jgi:hypothetical protein
MSEYIDIVFDGPPSHESGRFVEVEDAQGVSISVGGWVQREDGYWALRVPDYRALTIQLDSLRALLSCSGDLEGAVRGLLDKVEHLERYGPDFDKRQAEAFSAIKDGVIAQLRSDLGTEQTMHAAWEKRAYQAEADAAALREATAYIADGIGRIAEQLMAHSSNPLTKQVTDWLEPLHTSARRAVAGEGMAGKAGGE